MTGNKVFFESFNISVEAAYNAYSEINQKDILKGLRGNEEELKGYIENAAARWGRTPLDGLGGMTPEEYMDSANTLEDLLGMFRTGAVICDGALPAIFPEKLRSFGTEAVQALLGICRDLLPDDGEGSFMIPLMAVQVLGEWKIPEAADVLAGMLDYGGDMCDLLHEKVRDSLVSIGKPAVGSILKAIESRDVDSPACEYLLMALSDGACGSGSEEVYRCLKNSFIKMRNKSLGAICLGNYGDGRAIPALRGCLAKNRKDLDKETFYDIVSAINRLGGNVDDLGNQAPFSH